MAMVAPTAIVVWSRTIVIGLVVMGSTAVVMLVSLEQIDLLQTNLNCLLGRSHCVALHLAVFSTFFSKKAH